MNEGLAFLLIVSIFAFNAFCMNPSTLGLPSPNPPTGVKFDECFVVTEISSESLSTDLFSYNHICPEKFPYAKNVRDWYLVGSFKKIETLQSPHPNSASYVPLPQSLIQFVFLEKTIVEFVLRSTTKKYKVTFQTLQQGQAFYGMIYSDVKMSKAAPNKIGKLHEMTLREYREMDKNVEAQLEKVNSRLWCVTFKNGQGEPLLVFTKSEAALTSIRDPESDKPQLLLRIRKTFYILTFSSCGEATKFGNALSKYAEPLYIDHVNGNVRAHFLDNQITSG